jgi:hypothetical protein
VEDCAVQFTSTRLAALTLAMVMGGAAAGYAEEKAEPPPVADKGTTAQPNCIDESSKYTKTGNQIFFVQTFKNKCETRMKCAVFAYLINARGTSQGHATLILAPKSAGEAATKSYTLKVKGAGGYSSSDRECRAL